MKIKTWKKFALIFALLILTLGCKGRQFNDDLLPSKNLEQYINRATIQWIDVRMDDDAWIIFSADAADWRTATVPQEMTNWFLTELGVHFDLIAFWNFGNFIADVRQTQHYRDTLPSEIEFATMLKEALTDYIYEED